MKARLALVPVVMISLAAAALRAETAGQVIARARAYLGGETALNAVTSIHFSGRLEGTERVPATDDKTKLVDRPVSLPAEIIFQKPYQQLITLTRTDAIETTALDGYDAWQRRANPLKPAQWQVTLLDAGQIKRLRANTWENLSFFAGLEKKGGRVQLGDEVTVDGVACVKLSFIHDDNIIFVRYFEQATGRLIKTETENGAEIREEGEMIVNGVRFPKKVINKSANGQITTIAFDTVVLNEAIPASQFTVPILRAN
jgi:hypothetical protein